jgi:hypothetical protein
MIKEYVIRYHDPRSGYSGFVSRSGAMAVFGTAEEAAAFMHAGPLPSHGDRYAIRFEIVETWRLARPHERTADAAGSPPVPAAPVPAAAPEPEPEEDGSHAEPEPAGLVPDQLSRRRKPSSHA